MQRRAYLGSVATLLGGLSGCVAAPAAPRRTPTPEAAPTLAETGLPPTICQEPTANGDIRELVEPAVAPDWDGLAVPSRYGDLTDDAVVVGVERDGLARAYPLAVLWHHEIVNDDLGGPLLVTYCPICRSGMVADRRVAGQRTRFRVSGLLWRPESIAAAGAAYDGRVFGADLSSGETEPAIAGNLVMVDDATGSYWSQLLARAICGPQAGASLVIAPSTVARWGRWRADHPSGDVLLPPPHSTVGSR